MAEYVENNGTVLTGVGRDWVSGSAGFYHASHRVYGNWRTGARIDDPSLGLVTRQSWVRREESTFPDLDSSALLLRLCRPLERTADGHIEIDPPDIEVAEGSPFVVADGRFGQVSFPSSSPFSRLAPKHEEELLVIARCGSHRVQVLPSGDRGPWSVQFGGDVVSWDAYHDGEQRGSFMTRIDVRERDWHGPVWPITGITASTGEVELQHTATTVYASASAEQGVVYAAPIP